jgi:heptosyltransferase-3
MPSKMKRVLIYRMGSLGDTVVALPALHLIARSFPDAERRMLTNFPVSVKASAAEAVLGESGLVDGYFRYSMGTRSPVALLRLWWQLIRWRPQALVYLGGGKGVGAEGRDARFFRACGISKQIGVPLTKELQANLPGPDGELEPECERLARNIAELGDARLEDAASWDLHLTEVEGVTAREVLAPAAGRPLLAMSLGTKIQANDWGREQWKALMERVGEMYPGYALVLLGAKVEREACEFVAEGWRAGAGANGLVVNLCGQLTPRESAACLAEAKVFLGHDSGPAHLAAAVKTTCVAIYSARHLPRVWFPYGKQHRVVYHRVECAGCGLLTCIAERKRCLTSITVDEVLAEVEAVLG